MLVYPIIIYAKEKGEKYNIVYIPDFNGITEGENISDCMKMARDYIFNCCVELENNNEKFPVPFSNDNKQAIDDENLVIEHETLVDLDYDKYKRKFEQKIVKKNCSIPSWLAFEAEEANLNFSKVLKEGLKRELNIK